MYLSLYFAILLGTFLQIVASSPAQSSSNHNLRRDDLDPDWPYSHTVSLMLAPYANIEAFMKEWRSRAPFTHHGFGNHSSPAITSNNQSSAAIAFNRNPQDEVLGAVAGMSGRDDGGGSADVAKIFGITFGVLSGLFLLPLILGTYFLFRYLRKKQRQASEEAPSDVAVERVPVLQPSAQASSFSLNESSQHPEMQVRGTNSPSAIDRPASV
ncbi:hypothetical protein KCU95_g13896, partial [Aureobasidium melanogenum]